MLAKDLKNSRAKPITTLKKPNARLSMPNAPVNITGKVFASIILERKMTTLQANNIATTMPLRAAMAVINAPSRVM